MVSRRGSGDAGQDGGGVGMCSSGRPALLDPRIAAHFWVLVACSDRDRCWPWNGPKTGDGYGTFRVGSRKTTVCRYIAELELGRPLERGEYVLHRCDNPSCCNPDHIWVGTQTDNMRDAARKMRLSQGRSRSSYPGVSWDNARQKWQAHGYADGHSHALGRFENEEDAIEASRSFRRSRGAEAQ